MTEILIVRHGETTWNSQRRLQGHSDIALSSVGLRQAHAVALALKSESVDAIISSDLLRAQQTALIIAQPINLKLVLDRQLRERCYGVFEGLTYAEIEQRYPAEYRAWQTRAADTVMPSDVRVAESFGDFFRRSMDAITYWAKLYEGKKIVLVAHGGVLECAYRAALSMSLDTPRNFPIRNASINRFVVDGLEISLTNWGEVGHLDGATLDEVTA